MTLARALHEVRLQPGRYAATIAAIVVSVAFLAASLVLTATESAALAKRSVLYASRADVVVSSHLWHWPSGREQRDRALESARASLAANPDVAAFEPFSQVFSQVATVDDVADVMLTSTQAAPSLRWYDPVAGRLPQGPDEVLLTEDVAARLGVRVGDPVQLNLPRVRPLTVVGLTGQRGYATPPAYVVFDLIRDAEAQLPPADYRVLVNPKDTAGRTPGASSGGVGVTLLVKATDPSRADAVAETTQAALDKAGWMRIIATARPAHALLAEALEAQAAGGNATAQLINGSAAMSLLVGGLIIANTFTILLAQRRRQIGLLRAVGAGRGQVAVRFLTEAVVLGLLGSVVGVPLGIGLASAVSALITHSWPFGLVVPWLGLGGVVGVGVLVTVLAALVPVLRATRTAPLEALRPVAEAAGQRRADRTRAVLCGVLAVAGVALLGFGVTAEGPFEPGRRVLVAAAGGAALSVGVFAATPLFVPPLIGLLGRPLASLRPEFRVAVGNAVRNPARVGATASALMLAVGLIVLVQVGAASGRASAFAALDARYPVDVSIQSAVAGPELANANGAGVGPDVWDDDGRLLGFSPEALETVRATPGVADAGLFAMSEPMIVFTGAGIYDRLAVTALPPDAGRLLSHPVVVGPGEVGLSTDTLRSLKASDGTALTLFPLSGSSTTLRVVEANVGATVAVVSQETLSRMDTPTRPGLILASLTDPDAGDAAISRMTARLITTNPGLEVSGSGEQKAALRAFLDDLTAVMTGLLAVAALVALVGVGNTLALSVLERTRESGLLRALGLQRSALRWMLFVEALLVSVVAVAVGVLFGVGLGWLGAAAVARELGLSLPAVAVDGVQVAVTCLVVVLSGALASVLPGRRAARATPVEALADLG